MIFYLVLYAINPDEKVVSEGSKDRNTKEVDIVELLGVCYNKIVCMYK